MGSFLLANKSDIFAINLNQDLSYTVTNHTFPFRNSNFKIQQCQHDIVFIDEVNEDSEEQDFCQIDTITPSNIAQNIDFYKAKLVLFYNIYLENTKLFLLLCSLKLP
jgi:hypothetical protein